MTTKQSKNKVKKTSEAMEKKKYKKSVLECPHEKRDVPLTSLF